jgi:DNA methylase N-4/N-6 domain protein
MMNDVILGDCLHILKKIDNNSIDLIYLDPPFFTGKNFTGTAKDIKKQYFFKDTWANLTEYEQFIYDRLLLCKDKLKKTGSIFIHCDRNSTHILRSILDRIFGQNNFQSEIIWYYKRWSNSKKGLLNQHQTILFYSKSFEFKWNRRFNSYSLTTNLDQILQKRKKNSLGTSVYATDQHGNVIYNGQKKGVPLGDVWEIPFLNPKAKERTGYPTQKPIILLEKIIDLVTDEHDVVLDPFCGSGTTLVAASILKRNFIGIDISEDAVDLTRLRLSELIKTESKVLMNGIASYENNDPWVMKHLSCFDFSRIHRNKGLDAILNKSSTEHPIFLRVQRENEELIEAYKLMKKAIISKTNSIGYLIQTIENNNFSEISPLNENIKIIQSLDLQITTNQKKK